MSKATELAELAIILAMNAKPHKDTLHKSTNIERNALEDAKIILRNARKLHSIGERECNGFPVIKYENGKRFEYSELTEAQQAKLDKQSASCQKLIRKIVADYKTEARLENNSAKKTAIYFQADPRGCPVHIAFKSQTWIGG